jgi:hypothetical protein
MGMKNWRTTIIGALAAGGTAALSYFQTGGLDMKTAAIVAGFAVLGFFSKDAGVSGTQK